MKAPEITVIGDSHSSFFSGTESIIPPVGEPVRTRFFEVHHVGPGLAASLVERTSENNTRAKAFHALSGCDRASTRCVLLCFGEIDCRFHIMRRTGSDSHWDGPKIRSSVAITAHRYLSFVLEVALAGFRPLVFGPVATTPLRYDPPYEWPTLGSVFQRNLITRHLNDLLRGLCAANKIGFVSIFESLVGPGLETRREFYFDGVHLGRAAWPLFLRALGASSPDLLALLTGRNAASL